MTVLNKNIMISNNIRQMSNGVRKANQKKQKAKKRSKIFNPKTKRMVFKDLALGKRILKRYYVKSLDSSRLILKSGPTFQKQMKREKKLIDKITKDIEADHPITFSRQKRDEIERITKRLGWLIKTKTTVLLETSLKNKKKTKVESTEIVSKNFMVLQTRKPTKSQVIKLVKNYFNNVRKHTTYVKLESFDSIKDLPRIPKYLQKLFEKTISGKVINKAQKRNEKKFDTVMRLGSRNLNYPWSKAYDEAREDNNQCVIDYLKYELGECRRINKTKLTYKSLMETFKMNKLSDGVTIEQICNFVYGCQPYISLYIFGPDGDMYRKIHSKGSERSLCFLINNDHIYPVLNDKMKRSICKKEKFSLSDYKFIVDYDNHEYIETFEQLFKTNNKVKLISNEMDFNEVEFMVQSKTNTITTNYQYSGGGVSAFENNGVVYCKTLYYHDRVDLMKTLHDKYHDKCIYDPEMFLFKNQSYTTIGKTIYNYKFGKQQDMVSTLTDEQFDIFESYHIKPYQKCVTENISKTIHSHTFDICKSYMNVILTNEHNYNVFTMFDSVEKYDNRKIVNGEFYINDRFELAKGSKIYMENGFYPHNFVIYCLDNRYIHKSDITHMMIPSYSVDSNRLRNYAQYCIEHFKKDDVKKLVNHFIGSIGKKYNITDQAVNTNSRDVAIYLINKYEIMDQEVTLDWNDDMYLIRSKKKTRSLETSLPVHRSIIAGGIMSLDKLYKKVTHKILKYEPICYNVDSITIRYEEEPTNVLNNCASRYIEYDNIDGDEIIRENNDWVENIGKYEEENYKVRGLMLEDVYNPDYDHREMKELVYHTKESIDDFNQKKMSYAIVGPPGSGKSYQLKKMITDNDVVLSFTNKAVVILNTIKNKFTFGTKFADCKNDKDQLLKRVSMYDTIYVDEYSMTTAKHMMMLYTLHKAGRRIVFIGDHNQCLNIEDRKYRYIDCDIFRQMIGGNIVKLDYIEGKNRFDDKRQIECIEYLLKNKKLHPMMKNKKLDPTANHYITMLNGYKNHNKILNERSINNILKKNPKLKVIKIGGNKYFKGCCLIGKLKNKDIGICVSELYTIKNVNDNVCLLKSETGKEYTIETKRINSFLSYGYALTVYKYQGSKIQHKHNIINVDMMSFECIYTALSRAENYDDINIEYTDRVFENEEVSNVTIIKKQMLIKDCTKKKDKVEYKKKVYDIKPIKKIEYKFKIYNKVSKQTLKCVTEGYTKEFSYRKYGIEHATKLCDEWRKQLYVNL
jgi:hypothetical protein